MHTKARNQLSSKTDLIEARLIDEIEKCKNSRKVARVQALIFR
jgi:hypothetical protein